MTVRSLDFLDLPFLPRYRRGVLPLDSARCLTRGNPLGAMAMLSYLDPRRSIYTAVSSENGDSLMGQVILKEERSSARLTFLAPGENANSLTLPLLDHLAAQAGEWGAFYLLAEVEEGLPAFRALRQAGFAMYAWQRIWTLPRPAGRIDPSDWGQVGELDWPAIQSLHAQIVPALIQPVEPLPRQPAGLACRVDGLPQAHVLVQHGTQGTWLQPLIPPDSGCGSERLLSLAAALPERGSRPIYVCVRSYQAWLEAVLEDLGAEAGPRQAVMVKRLAKTIKESQAVQAVDKVLAKAKPAAPITQVTESSMSKRNATRKNVI
jgi:hypothetical protein